MHLSWTSRRVSVPLTPAISLTILSSKFNTANSLSLSGKSTWGYFLAAVRGLLVVAAPLVEGLGL